jgi:pilus assembly protein CpaF
MVSFVRRPEGANALDARIAELTSRRTSIAPAPTSAPSAAPEIAPASFASQEDRLLAAREQLLIRLKAEIRPERRHLLSRGELAKLVEAAVHGYLLRHAIEANALERRDLATNLVDALLTPLTPEAEPDPAAAQRRANRTVIETAKTQIQPLVLDHMDVAAAAEMPRATFEAQLAGWVKELLVDTKLQLNFSEQRDLVQSLIADMLGLGPIEPLMDDETVTDIMVNGPKQVYVERRGKLELTDLTFRDDQHVMNVATKIVTRIGRRVDESRPLVDARLADGSRVNIIIPPLAIDGPSISIRKFSKKTITLDTMAQQANISPEMATLLKIAARCRLNILISGGTGSGKTTLLNALSRLIDTAERTVTIEDAAELQCSSRMSCASKPARRTSKEPARSRCVTCCATRCACGPTASSSARSGALKRSTYCRR